MRKLLFNIVMTLSLVLPLLATPALVAAGCPSGSTPKDQVLSGVAETGSDCSGAAVPSAINTAVKILSYVAGVVAVIMVIVAGFKYITSGGDAGKVTSAKSTLTYALVGLAVAALAQLLVHFVLSQANGV